MSTVGNGGLSCLYSAVALVVLSVVETEFSIMEPDVGQNTTILACVAANISMPSNRDTVYDIVNITSSTPHFVISPLRVVIPANFTGMFQTCIQVLVFDDNLMEPNRVIMFAIQPLMAPNRVVYPPGSNFVRININDSDSKCLCVTACLCLS